MVANIPRCEAVIIDVIAAFQEKDVMACHEEESVKQAGPTWQDQTVHCACIVFDLFLAVPDSLSLNFAFETISYLMSHGLFKLLPSLDTFIGINPPPPRA